MLFYLIYQYKLYHHYSCIANDLKYIIANFVKKLSIAALDRQLLSVDKIKFYNSVSGANYSLLRQYFYLEYF